MTNINWKKNDLISWRNSLNWSQDMSSHFLGISLRAYVYLEKGRTKISRRTVFACLQLSKMMEDCPEIKNVKTQIEEHFNKLHVL